MRFRSLCAAACAALLAASTLGAAHAQGAGYPTQRITIVVGFAAGGPVDVIARIIADGLQRRWNQTVVVENRTGTADKFTQSAQA